MDESEESSLLGGRESMGWWGVAETGFAASEREREAGDGRRGGPSDLLLSTAWSVSMPDLVFSVR